MDEDNSARLWELFFEVQRGLPRQGPGDRDSTLQALHQCVNLPDHPQVLDIGCGPGAQTLVLASALPGHFVAVDTTDEYLDQLRVAAQEAGFADRVEVRNADMGALPFGPDSFDLIWSEGAAYILGIAQALERWRPLLRANGYLAFTELVWLEDQPPAEIAEFFGREYPAMANVAENLSLIERSGYEPVGDFTLPDSAWWDDYYTPLARKLPALQQKYAGDPEALSVIAMSEQEIEMRRRFGSAYGYQFFVARKRDR